MENGTIFPPFFVHTPAVQLGPFKRRMLSDCSTILISMIGFRSLLTKLHQSKPVKTRSSKKIGELDIPPHYWAYSNDSRERNLLQSERQIITD